MNWEHSSKIDETWVVRIQLIIIVGICIGLVYSYFKFDQEFVKFIAYLIGACIVFWLTNRRVEAIERNVKLTEKRQSIERFTSFVRLIESESSCVTVGAVHALHRMASEDEDVRIDVFPILCEFLRQNSKNVETNVKKIVARLLFECKPSGGTNYSALNLQAYLPDVDMNGWDLSGMKFESAILTGADLTSAILKGTNFDSANLYGAKLSNIKVNSSTSMRGADLRVVEISSTFLDQGVNFTGADMTGSLFTSVDFSNCNFTNVTMNEATFKYSKFYDANSLTKNQSGAVKSLYACEGLPKNLEDELKQEKPELFLRK